MTTFLHRLTQILRVAAALAFFFGFVVLFLGGSQFLFGGRAKTVQGIVLERDEDRAPGRFSFDNENLVQPLEVDPQAGTPG
jgi:hypothetical protein